MFHSCSECVNPVFQWEGYSVFTLVWLGLYYSYIIFQITQYCVTKQRTPAKAIRSGTDTDMVIPGCSIRLPRCLACWPGEYPSFLPPWSPWSRRQDWLVWHDQSNTPGLLSCSSCGDDILSCPWGTPRQLRSQDLCILLFLSPLLDTPFHHPFTCLSAPQSSLNKAMPKCSPLIVPVLVHLHSNLLFWYYCLAQAHLGLT